MIALWLALGWVIGAFWVWCLCRTAARADRDMARWQQQRRIGLP